MALEGKRMRKRPEDTKLERNYRELACRDLIGPARLVNRPVLRPAAFTGRAKARKP